MLFTVTSVGRSEIFSVCDSLLAQWQVCKEDHSSYQTHSKEATSEACDVKGEGNFWGVRGILGSGEEDQHETNCEEVFTN